MRYSFSLQILANSEQAAKITQILDIEPNNPHSEWRYELIVENNGYTNFIDQFINILDSKYDELENIGIVRGNISVWMICFYDDEQCNIKILPDEMKKLGNNGITLCISCA